MVKIGITSYSLSRAMRTGEMNLFDVIQWTAENGGAHLELSVGDLVPLKGNRQLCADLVKAAADAGIELSGYTVGANFIQPDQDAYRKEIARVKEEVDTAAMLGVKRMRHDAGWRPQEECGYVQFEKDFPSLVNACGEIADYAKQFGIVTSVENHGYFVQGSERVLRLVNAVNRENFRTLMDVGNFQCADEDSVCAAMNNVKYASFIHFKDFYVRRNMEGCEGFFRTLHGRYLKGAIVGYGDVDTPAVVEVIKKSGYDGFISVEFEGAEECRMGTRIGLANLKRMFGIS